MGNEVVLVVVVAIVMVIGLAGTVLPVLPGIWLMWSAALVYGLIAGFGFAGIASFAIITLIAIGGAVAGVIVPQRGASRQGVPWWGQLVAAAFAVVGLFMIPVVGAVVGFIVGIIAVSVVTTRDVGVALPAAWAALRSMLLASGMQLSAGIVIAVVWLAWVFAV